MPGLEIQTSDMIESPWTAWFLYGAMGCIAGDQFVPYAIYRKEGKGSGQDDRLQNGKGGTMERLYMRFNGIRIPGQGSYQRPQTIEARYYVPSMDEHQSVRQREIAGVVESGVKPCVRVTTVGGRSIVCTPDHRFATTEGYAPIVDLGIGAQVLIHTGRTWTSGAGKAAAKRRMNVCVKHHPIARTKVVRARTSRTEEVWADYTYKNLAYSRLVYEAVHLNALSPEEFRARLNDGALDGLKFLPAHFDVHHVDENPKNDDPKNLVALTHADHAREHGLSEANLQYIAEEDEIASITPVGDVMTYDIQMKQAPHNFVCEGFVVHNSSKTWSAATFPTPLFLVPANENSQLTLAQLKSRKIDYIRIGKRPDGTVVAARAHLSEILGELEKRHSQMRILLGQMAKAEAKGDEQEAARLNTEADKTFPWQTIVVESLSHFSDELVEDVGDHGRKKMDQQAWGLIGSFLRTMHSRLRNMDVHIVYTSLAKTQESESGGITSGGPNLIGQAAEKFPAMCDVVAYLEELAPQGKDAKPIYRAFFRKYRWWQARARFAGFPDFCDDFDFAKLAPKIVGSSKT